MGLAAFEPPALPQNIEFLRDFDEITRKSQCCIVTATPENMAVALETTFLSAIGPKL